MAEFNTLDCAHCNILFGVSHQFEGRRRADKASFYCPNGHRMSFPGETAAEMLAKTQAVLTQKAFELDVAQKRLRSCTLTLTKLRTKK